MDHAAQNAPRVPPSHIDGAARWHKIPGGRLRVSQRTLRAWVVASRQAPPRPVCCKPITVTMVVILLMSDGCDIVHARPEVCSSTLMQSVAQKRGPADFHIRSCNIATSKHESHSVTTMPTAALRSACSKTSGCHIQIHINIRLHTSNDADAPSRQQQASRRTLLNVDLLDT